MKRKGQRPDQIMITLNEAFREKLDKLVKESSMTRSEYIRSLIVEKYSNYIKNE